MKNFLFAAAAALATSPTGAAAQPQSCPLQGDAVQPLALELNPYKNRDDAPPASRINPKATLAAVIAPGSDLNRWSRNDGAIIEGTVIDVKVGGIETVNCHARDPAHRDTHIELALDSGAAPIQRVIVEVTPRWRDKMASVGDWSTAALKQRLTGRQVRVTGWLFDDLEHRGEAENTNPGGARNWRASVWEIHPITGIEILPAAAAAATAATAAAAALPGKTVSHHRRKATRRCRRSSRHVCRKSSRAHSRRNG